MLGPWLLMIACAGGCIGPDVGDFVLTVEPAEAMPAVAVATWSTNEPGTSYVEFGPDETYGFRTAESTEPTAEHRWVIPAFPAITTWHIRAHTVVDGVDLESADTVYISGSLATDVPAFTTEGSRQHPGWVVTTLLGSEPYAVILNDRGQYTWSYAGSHDKVFTRARISLDGQAMVFNSFAEDREVDAGSILRVSFDGATVTETRTVLGHHDFVELPEGGYAFIAIDIREYDGRSIVGDSIVEISVDGTESRVVWNSWDTWTPPREHMSDDFYPQGEDWIHGNTLEYNAAERTYLLSMHNRDSVGRIDRDSGELLWELGGDDSDFALTAGTAFGAQHGPSIVGDDFFIYDNTESGCCSFARGYTLDYEALTYAETWTVQGKKGFRAQQFGQVIRYDDGATFIDWGSAAYFSELDADDKQNWRADVEFGTIPTYVQPITQIGAETPL